MQDRLPRKLAAILYADVAGYSCLTGTDEDATHRALGEYLDVISATVESHRGQVMHYAGDAVLAMFGAVIDAMSSALAIQQELRVRNAGLPAERRVEFRIGVNLGDVIEDRGDIYGDGVNVAARLEALADPGGICVSDSVRTSVGKRLDMHYQDMGKQEVKNIEEPVRAYKVIRRSGEQPPISAPDSVTAETTGKRSIAVLPFVNMSGDPEQEYFADGITDDIITDVSKVSGLFVIARNSSFAYKKQRIDIKVIGRKLGVRHVLEGSVRKAGTKVRINVQLVDTESGGHVWTERYDRDLEDIFVVQDEVTRSVVETLKVTLTGSERARREERGKVNSEAYDCLIRGRSCLLQFTAQALVEARAMLARALALDPGLTQAHGYQAIVLAIEYLNDWNDPAPDHLDQALALARRGCEANESDANSRNALALSLMWLRRLDEAESAARLAIGIDPNFSEAHGGLGNVLHFAGRNEEAIESFERALRLDPAFHIWLHACGRAQLALQRYEQAEAAFKRRLIHMPRSDVTRAYLASLYGHTGRVAQAAQIWRELMDINPGYTPEHSLRILPYADPAPLEHFVEGLRKAGLAR